MLGGIGDGQLPGSEAGTQKSEGLTRGLALDVLDAINTYLIEQGAAMRVSASTSVHRRELSTVRYPFIVQAAAAAANRSTSVCSEWHAREANDEPVTVRTEFYCTTYDTLVVMSLPRPSRSDAC